jgi:hypothetical protein
MMLSRRNSWAIAAGLSLVFLILNTLQVSGDTKKAKGISKAAAESCGLKVKQLEEYAAKPTLGKKKTTRFDEAEVNSYLALELKEKYHPSLKSLLLTFQKEDLQGVASLDFDHLSVNAKGTFTRLIARMFSGVHDLTVRGDLIASEGKGSFKLHEARFDQTTLPNFLVEEIIAAVGKKQKPPFDPTQPSQLPYGIERVDLHAGYILVHQ